MLTTFRRDVEGLRALAVLLVVLYHYRLPDIPGGFVGVDLFFVVSGYLITGLLVAEIRKTSRVNLPAFYARRARRLLPASALTLVVTLLAGAIVLAPHELAFAGRAARATALYMSNMFFATNAADELLEPARVLRRIEQTVDVIEAQALQLVRRNEPCHQLVHLPECPRVLDA